MVRFPFYFVPRQGGDEEERSVPSLLCFTTSMGHRRKPLQDHYLNLYNRDLCCYLISRPRGKACPPVKPGTRAASSEAVREIWEFIGIRLGDPVALLTTPWTRTTVKQIRSLWFATRPPCGRQSVAIPTERIQLGVMARAVHPCLLLG